MTALFQNILTASFHGSIVIAVVLGLRLLLRKAPKKYICYLWLLAGIRLLMPFEIQSDLSLQPQSVPDTMIRWEQPAPVHTGNVDKLGVPETQSISAQVPAVSQETPVDSPAIPVESAFDFTSLIPYAWLAVGSVFLLYSLCGYVNLRKKVRHAVKIPGGWESEGIDTAFILGFVKPQIYIPMGMAPVTRKHILAHERTHLDKGDHWIKMIGFLALALHWFNPLVWVAYILLCKDIEMACDERVVQFMELSERKEYSTALLNCSTNRIHFAASPVAFGEVSVKSRITSILNYRKPSFWVGLLSVMAIVFVTVCLVTSPTKPAETPALSATEPTMAVEAAEAGFTPAVQPPMDPNPDWGLGIVAEVHSPTTMTLYYGVDVEDIPWDGTPLYKDHPYWLEKWDGESWEELPMLVQTPSYGTSYGMELSKDNAHGFYNSEDIDWSLLYGELPEGDYRIGIRLTRNGEIKPHYAWFHIYANTLTGEEAEALARCEKALDLLTQQDYYACLISESTSQGKMVPVKDILKSGADCRVDYYYGDYCYSNLLCEADDPVMQSWDDAFRLAENKHISFPEDESQISGEYIRFLTQWTDLEGVPYQETNTYAFDEYGKLASAHRLIQHEEEGVLVQSQRQLTVRDYSFGAINDLPEGMVTEEVKDDHEAAEESPWGIFFRVDDDYLKPTGGEVWFGMQNSVGVTNYSTDSSYWLERKGEEKWEKLPASGEPSWGSETYRLKSRTTIVNVDWSSFYGKLEPGLYRMGKRFYSEEESIIQYSEFLIYPESGIHGEGAEEAIARVDAALEKLCSGNYHITHENGWGFRGKRQVNTVYWKYDGICVTDYYDYQRGDGYSHSAVDTKDSPDAYIFYDAFMNILNWHENYSQTYFAEGLSVISDEEISFVVGYGRSTTSMLNYYSFFFDEEGNITSFQWYMNDGYASEGSANVYTVQDTSEEEIKAWVEKIQAEQA